MPAQCQWQQARYTCTAGACGSISRRAVVSPSNSSRLQAHGSRNPADTSQTHCRRLQSRNAVTASSSASPLGMESRLRVSLTPVELAALASAAAKQPGLFTASGLVLVQAASGDAPPCVDPALAPSGVQPAGSLNESAGRQVEAALPSALGTSGCVTSTSNVNAGAAHSPLPRAALSAHCAAGPCQKGPWRR